MKQRSVTKMSNRILHRSKVWPWGNLCAIRSSDPWGLSVLTLLPKPCQSLPRAQTYSDLIHWWFPHSWRQCIAASLIKKMFGHLRWTLNDVPMYLFIVTMAYWAYCYLPPFWGWKHCNRWCQAEWRTCLGSRSSLTNVRDKSEFVSIRWSLFCGLHNSPCFSTCKFFSAVNSSK